jgi:A/G-specific adenine glycosylase
LELGAVVCTARQPRCPICPLSTHCVWRATGRPLPPGRSRRPQRYAGTDRQVRGELLAVLRKATGPVPRTRLDLAWADAPQRERALGSLLADGLVVALAGRRYALAGEDQPPHTLAGEDQPPHTLAGEDQPPHTQLRRNRAIDR